MKTRTVEEELQEIIIPYLKDIKEFSPEDDIVDNLGIDSLDMVDILVEIEDIFSIELQEEEINNLRKVKDIISLIEKKIA